MEHPFYEVNSQLTYSWAVLFQVVFQLFSIGFPGAKIRKIMVDLTRLICNDHTIGLEVTDNLIYPLHLSKLSLFYLRP